MSYFKDADEVYRLIGGLMEELGEDEELGLRFHMADTVVQYRFSDPEATITVVMLTGAESRVDFGDTELEPEVVVSMDADVAHAFWLGKVNAMVALARGQLKAVGPVGKILKVLPLAKYAIPRYQAKLEAGGRVDVAT